MLNKDLKAELNKFPDDIVVEIEGYAAGTETENRGYEITAVDGWQDEYGGKGITVWGRLVGTERTLADEVMAENQQLRAALNELLAHPRLQHGLDGYPFFERIKKLAQAPSDGNQEQAAAIPAGWTLKTEGDTEEGDRMWNSIEESWMPITEQAFIGAPVICLRPVITRKS